VFAKLGEKFGDLTGRVETDIRPSVSFDDIGGLRQAKATLKGFAYALTHPELYEQWGITPPKGVLLYGPPGTGKSKLARALATASQAIFYHIKLLNLTSKFGANTGELLQEILRIAIAEGRGVLFLDEAEALSLEHLLPPPQAREASARLVATLCERLDGVAKTARILVVASTSRTDALDSALVAPGRLDHLVEVPLPDADEQRVGLRLLLAELAQVHLARLVRAVLAPHHREDAELHQVGLAPHRRQDVLVFLGAEAMGFDDFRSNLGHCGAP